MPKLKKKNNLCKLSKISDISKKEIRKIWVDVKANHKLLDSCSKHQFQPHESSNMSRRFECKNCKGVVGLVEKSWYEKGLNHA